MATIVNTPGTTSESSSMNGVLIGIILIFALMLLFWIFGMPYVGRSGAPTTNVENNVQAPEVPEQVPAQTGDTNINVPIPDQIDVNVENKDSEQ